MTTLLQLGIYIVGPIFLISLQNTRDCGRRYYQRCKRNDHSSTQHSVMSTVDLLHRLLAVNLFVVDNRNRQTQQYKTTGSQQKNGTLEEPRGRKQCSSGKLTEIEERVSTTQTSSGVF